MIFLAVVLSGAFKADTGVVISLYGVIDPKLISNQDPSSDAVDHLWGESPGMSNVLCTVSAPIRDIQFVTNYFYENDILSWETLALISIR